MQAVVYVQREPKVARQLRTSKEIFTEYDPVFEQVGLVEGTHSECWAAAKKLAELPVLEFSGADYVPGA